MQQEGACWSACSPASPRSGRGAGPARAGPGGRAAGGQRGRRPVERCDRLGGGRRHLRAPRLRGARPRWEVHRRQLAGARGRAVDLEAPEAHPLRGPPRHRPRHLHRGTHRAARLAGPALLRIDADDRYHAYVNGVLVAAQSRFDDTIDTVPVTLAEGATTLTVNVSGNAIPKSRPKTNPAGVIFRLDRCPPEGCVT